MSPVRLFCAAYDAAIAQGIPAGEATEAAAEQVWRAALERAAGLVKAKREHWNEEAASYGERREWDATNAAESKEAAAGECESAIRRELEKAHV